MFPDTMRRREFLLLLGALRAGAQDIKLPNRNGSIRFAVMGDTGNGERAQYDVATMMSKVRAKFPFEFVIMCGDNIYGGERERDFDRKFGEPYKALLNAGVKFYASLGNHDNPSQRFYKPLGMDGRRFYSFTPGKNAKFFALDSTYMDKEQLLWLEKELSGALTAWKICYFHHPLYSSGRTHGSDVQLRAILEPLFVKYGVNVVFSGHDHIYERIKPQKGIAYFVCGSGGQLRKSNTRQGSELTAKAFDQDNVFMVCEIAGNQLFYQAIERNGDTVDSGSISTGNT